MRGVTRTTRAACVQVMVSQSRVEGHGLVEYRLHGVMGHTVTHTCENRPCW